MTVFDGRRDLLDSFRRGESAALSEVYRHTVRKVAQLVRWGFRLDAQGVTVPGASDAERERELVQETFLKAFAVDARLAYDGLKPYQPYLLRIAKNLLIDDGRKAGRVVLSSAPHLEGDDEPIEPSRPADEELHWRKLRQATVAWCSTLSPQLQTLVKLRFEDGLAQQAVADALGVSRRRVREWEEEVRQGLSRALEHDPTRGDR